MEPKLPPLPLDLDTSPARMSIQIKAGELAELIRRWGRDVYARARQAAPEAASQPDGDPWQLGFEAGKRVGAQLAPQAAATASQQAEAVDVLRLIRDTARFDANGAAYYRIAENELARIECRDAAPQAATTASAGGAK